MIQESTSEKVVCPVCNAQCKALIQYCEQCGWHFEMFLSRPDQEQQVAYQQRLERHRALWTLSIDEPKETIRNVPSPLFGDQLATDSQSNAKMVDVPDTEDVQSTESATDASQSSKQSFDGSRDPLSLRTNIIVVVCLLCVVGVFTIFFVHADKTVFNSSAPRQSSNTSTTKTNEMVKSPHKDTDKDGHADINDKCPDKPEDYDGYQDADGCPDIDNDNDGILDRDDKCPLKKEDVDGFKDKDGCPDSDNDTDYIHDDKDTCPNDPEDRDGYQDLDGCPDPDNDGDNVLDINDKCPNIPGVSERKGCPDKTKSGAKIKLNTDPKQLVEKTKTSPKQVDISPQIFFTKNSSRISNTSHALLNTYAHIIKNNPKVKHVKVEGHSDFDENSSVSSARAQSIKSFLVNKGIPSSKLILINLRSQKPIVPKHKRYRYANQRAVIKIVSGNNIQYKKNSTAHKESRNSTSRSQKFISFYFRESHLSKPRRFNLEKNGKIELVNSTRHHIYVRLDGTKDQKVYSNKSVTYWFKDTGDFAIEVFDLNQKHYKKVCTVNVLN